MRSRSLARLRRSTPVYTPAPNPAFLIVAGIVTALTSIAPFVALVIR